jgi:hypothetical protein
MTISGFFQFVIGFILGTIFFTAGVGGGIYFFLNKMSLDPSKPVYSEEKPEKVAKNQPSPANSNTNNHNRSSIFNNNKTQESASKNEDLPSGAYRARVTWSTGLSLRAQPDQNAERIGGVGYNWEIIILSYSGDGQWQKVRIPSSGQEGWIKAGNVEKLE